jgi:hypothetical protein
VPLSEEELRLLEQMERALVADDPKLASTLRGTSLRRHARRKAYVGGAVFLLGIAVLMTGAVMRLTVVGIVGFMIMLGAAYVALSSWRGQNVAPTPGEPSDPHAPFTLIEGGRAKKRSSRARSQQHHSFMDRLEERWRRRRDQNGF